MVLQLRNIAFGVAAAIAVTLATAGCAGFNFERAQETIDTVTREVDAA